MILLASVLISVVAYLPLATGDAASCGEALPRHQTVSLIQTRQNTARTAVHQEEATQEEHVSHPVDDRSVRTVSLMETGKNTVRKVVAEADEAGQAVATAVENMTEHTVQKVVHEARQASHIVASAVHNMNGTRSMHSMRIRLQEEITLLWHHPSKLWEQAAFLAQGFFLNEADAMPARSGQQLMRVFMIVFCVVAVSWLFRLVVSSKLNDEYLPKLRLVTHCLSLSACSWGMTVANKHLMIKLGTPGFVIVVQMAIGIVVAIILAGGKLSLQSKHVKRWMVVSIFTCLQLWTSLYTMKHLSLSMLMIIRNLGPVYALPCEWLVMPLSKRPEVTGTTIFALLLVLTSAFTYCGGVDPSLEGCMFAFLNMCLAVIDAVLRRRLLSTECADMSTTMCMLLNNVVGIVPSVLLIFCTGELLDVGAKTTFSMYTIAVLLISGVMGSGISYFALNVQREIAATSFMVLENGIRLTEVLAGVLVFKDPFTWPAQVVGLVFSYCGSLWYAKLQAGRREPIKPALAFCLQPTKGDFVHS